MDTSPSVTALSSVAVTVTVPASSRTVSFVADVVRVRVVGACAPAGTAANSESAPRSDAKTGRNSDDRARGRAGRELGPQGDACRQGPSGSAHGVATCPGSQRAASGSALKSLHSAGNAGPTAHESCASSIKLIPDSGVPTARSPKTCFPQDRQGQGSCASLNARSSDTGARNSFAPRIRNFAAIPPPYARVAFSAPARRWTYEGPLAAGFIVHAPTEGVCESSAASQGRNAKQGQSTEARRTAFVRPLSPTKGW